MLFEWYHNVEWYQTVSSSSPTVPSETATMTIPSSDLSSSSSSSCQLQAPVLNNEIPVAVKVLSSSSTSACEPVGSFPLTNSSPTEKQKNSLPSVVSAENLYQKLSPSCSVTASSSSSSNAAKNTISTPKASHTKDNPSSLMLSSEKITLKKKVHDLAIPGFALPPKENVNSSMPKVRERATYSLFMMKLQNKEQSFIAALFFLFMWNTNETLLAKLDFCTQNEELLSFLVNKKMEKTVTNDNFTAVWCYLLTRMVQPTDWNEAKQGSYHLTVFHETMHNFSRAEIVYMCMEQLVIQLRNECTNSNNRIVSYVESFRHEFFPKTRRDQMENFSLPSILFHLHKLPSLPEIMQKQIYLSMNETASSSDELDNINNRLTDLVFGYGFVPSMNVLQSIVREHETNSKQWKEEFCILGQKRNK
jgi:hypothetical protein